MTHNPSLTLAVVALAAAVGCSWTENFDESLLGENTSASCSDGLDNDGNGLTDCQQFECSRFPVCCDVPAVVLEDEFPSPDNECAAPDGSKWNAWGTPLPVVCDGALWPNKPNSCYDVGVVARQPVRLRSGVAAVVGVRGRPEVMGRVGVGLTFQANVIGSSDACASIDGVAPFASIEQEHTTAGYRFSANFDQQTLGKSAEITDDDRHELVISIDDDGVIYFSLDGASFAASPASQPVTVIDRDAFLTLYGRGLTAHFTDAAIYAGSQCEAPMAWSPSEHFVALLPGADDDHGWDWLEVFAPMVVRGALDELVLYYHGCNGSGDCDVGRAIETEAGVLARDEANPIGDTGAPWNYPTNGQATAGFTGPRGTTVVLDAPLGAWDEQLGGFSVVEHGDVYYLWYEGRSILDPTWRIGLAISTDGGLTFAKHPNNPVVTEGRVDQFDGRGVSSPTVVYDEARGLFRMWYAAAGFLGASSSIGYAVSTNGADWVKYDEPVVTAERVGLLSIAGPSVIADRGGFRLFIEGTEATEPARAIYEVVNRGIPSNE